MKLCKNCQYFTEPRLSDGTVLPDYKATDPTCAHSSAVRPENLVLGDGKPFSCFAMRSGICGTEGALFAPKELQ